MTHDPDLIGVAVRLCLEIADLRRDIVELRRSLEAARPLLPAPRQPAPLTPWDPQRPWDAPVIVCRSAIKSRPRDDTTT